MTDYCQLIAHAIAGLDKSTGESRRALYGRMRSGLVDALRNLDPPLSESEITRQRVLLEEAIRKVEADALRRPQVEARLPPPVAKTGPAGRAGPAEKSALRNGGRSTASGEEPTPGIPLSNPELRPEGQRDETSAGDSGPQAPAPIRDRAREPEAEWSGANRARKPHADAPAGVPELDDFRQSLEKAIRNAEADAARSRPEPKRNEGSDSVATWPAYIRDRSSVNATRQPFGGPPASIPDLDDLRLSLEKAIRNVEANAVGSEAKRCETSGGDSGEAPPAHTRARSRKLEAAPPSRADTARQPLAGVSASVPDLDRFEPRIEPHGLKAKRESIPPISEPHPRRESRPSPPQPLRARQAAAEVAAAGAPGSSKKALMSAFLTVFIVVALALALYWLRGPLKAVFMRGPAAQLQHQPTLSRPKLSDGLGQVEHQGSSIAQRVVLYEGEPADPQAKRYVGSVIWQTETASPGPEQAREAAVKAELEIPERHVNMRMLIHRNTDKALPASHLIEIMFNLPGDFSFGGIANVPRIVMKEAEQKTGTPLAGLTVKVTPSFFLVGLSAFDTTEVQRNLQLLKERPWLGIQVVYNNGTHALLFIEKGSAGERSFREAFTAWGE